MKILFLVTLVCLLAFAYAGKDLCSYDWCAKEELSGCEEGDKMTREACNRRGGLYITYRRGTLRGSEHKCCMWKMRDIPSKHLYCVRNIRSSDQLCTTESLDYKIKIKTTQQCTTLSCT